MKKTAWFVLLLSCLIPFASNAADTNQPPRLTVELRDGSRVVGESLEKNFNFQSVLLGKIKLAVKDIRAVNCVSSNSAKLSTANGDTLTVSFVDSEFAVKTSFGKVNLAVDSVRKLSVSAGGSGAHPPGLVALWSGEGDGNDSVGNNNGMLRRGARFSPGKVGQAFMLDDNAYVEVPNSPELTPSGPFTVMAWVNYLRTSGNYSSVPIIAKGQDAKGPIDWFLGISPGRKLRPHVNVGGSWVYFDCATPLAPGEWNLVTMVYDGVSLRGYVNGVLDGTQPVSGSLLNTDNSLKIGAYAPINGGADGGFCLPGQIDEAAFYNRALSDSEIRDEYESVNKN